jgi:hypothetical protein
VWWPEITLKRAHPWDWRTLAIGVAVLVVVATIRWLAR